jgi:hypothetical protein
MQGGVLIVVDRRFIPSFSNSQVDKQPFNLGARGIQAHVPNKGGAGLIREGEWTRHTMKIRERLGVSFDFKPWSAKKALVGLGHSERERHIIDIAWIERLAQNMTFLPEEELVKGYWASTNKVVQCRPFGKLASLMQGHSVITYMVWLCCVFLVLLCYLQRRSFRGTARYYYVDDAQKTYPRRCFAFKS